jgi:hypothetical protein
MLAEEHLGTGEEEQEEEEKEEEGKKEGLLLSRQLCSTSSRIVWKQHGANCERRTF